MGQKNGYFGQFGGRFVPEILVQPLIELEQAFITCWADTAYQNELNYYLKSYCHRPTPLYFAANLSREIGAKLYLKREDLNPTGAHKITNCLGQALLARKMKKRYLLAETGAGQHGLAVATVAAMFDLKCRIYMGEVDYQRQAINVEKMKLLGAEVVCVRKGSRTLKDATNEALRDWATSCKECHYLLGSAVGPHPYPLIVRQLQKVIGREVKQQLRKLEKRSPDYLVAAIGGGSNAIGLFYPFRFNHRVKLIGVEAGGRERSWGAASLQKGKIGVFHGSCSYLLQTAEGQVVETNSISAGLDYPAVGPEICALYQQKRIKAVLSNDREAREAFFVTARLEGIIPALESAHAISWVMKRNFPTGSLIVLNLSGRGEKDLEQIKEVENEQIATVIQ